MRLEDLLDSMPGMGRGEMEVGLRIDAGDKIFELLSSGLERSFL